MVTFYTSAPEAYDYGYVTRDEKPVAYMNLLKGDVPIWKVTMPERFADYQSGRYASGMYPTMTHDDLLEHQKNRLVRLTE